MKVAPKLLPHTQCVKGKYWYFRSPKTKKLMKLEGQPGDPCFMAMYRRLLNATGATLKQQKQRQRIRRAEIRLARSGDAFVYFIGIEPDGPVKIGMTVDVQERLCTLQTGMPQQLAVLATCKGGLAKEREYHQRFRDARIRGEWFERVPDLLLEISALEQNGGIG